MSNLVHFDLICHISGWPSASLPPVRVFHLPGWDTSSDKIHDCIGYLIGCFNYFLQLIGCSWISYMIGWYTWLGAMRISWPCVSGMPLDLLHWYSRTASTTPLLPCTADVRERDEEPPSITDTKMLGRMRRRWRAEGAHLTEERGGKGAEYISLKRHWETGPYVGPEEESVSILYRRRLLGVLSKTNDSKSPNTLPRPAWSSSPWRSRTRPRTPASAPPATPPPVNAARRAGSACVRRLAALRAKVSVGHDFLRSVTNTKEPFIHGNLPLM